MRHIYLVFILISSVFLIACSSSKPTPKVIQTPHLQTIEPSDTNSPTGVMVLSFSCHLPEYNAQQISLQLGKKQGIAISAFKPVATLNVPCRSARQLIVEHMPQGTYRIRHWALPTTSDPATAESKTKTESLHPPFYFSIKPGLVTYVGSLKVYQQQMPGKQAQHQNAEHEELPEPVYSYHIAISQQLDKKDIKWFRARYHDLATLPLRKASL